MRLILRRFSGRLRARWQLLGALPARHVCTALVVVFSGWVLADVFFLRLSSGLSTSTYDAMVRARLVAAPADPRILIVDIDESSLLAMSREFGRWPWPRDTLATVLDYLEKQEPAAIVWDIAFADADRLSPGGDKAFDEAVRRSQHSFFSVVRLPAANDGFSRLRPAQLPHLWLQSRDAQAPASSPAEAPAAALIAPVLPAVAAARLGYNNGYPDVDGVLRRYRYLDEVGGGWALKSLPFSVAERLAPQAAVAIQRAHADSPVQLMAWRRHANSYPRLPFARVFAAADGGVAAQPLPQFKGKVIIIGSTAPSLHDIHPTPLSPVQAGVDSLATAIDNALNQRHMGELPRWLQAALTIGLCVGLAVWVRLRGVASLDPALIALPVALLVLSYASLNLANLFVDLYLPAALALLFLTALRTWNNLRRNYWCQWDPADLAERHAADAPLALWACKSGPAWVDARLDRLVDAVERHLPGCRIVVADASFNWPGKLRWPELASYAAIVGPRAALEAEAARLPGRLRCVGSATVPLPPGASGETVAACALRQWSNFAIPDHNRSLSGAIP